MKSAAAKIEAGLKDALAMSLPDRRPLDHLTLAKVAVQEEVGELLQIIGKIDRFGIRSHHPETFVTNLEELAGEIGDLTGALHFYTKEVARALSQTERVQFYSIINTRLANKKKKLVDLNEARGGEGT